MNPGKTVSFSSRSVMGTPSSAVRMCSLSIVRRNVTTMRWSLAEALTTTLSNRSITLDLETHVVKM